MDPSIQHQQEPLIPAIVGRVGVSMSLHALTGVSPREGCDVYSNKTRQKLALFGGAE